MRKIYYISNVASITAAIKGLNSTYNVAEFYDSYSYIELLPDGEIEIHLDINGIINANGDTSFAVVDRSRKCSHVATFVDYGEARAFVLEEPNYIIIDATGQYDIYL